MVSTTVTDLVAGQSVPKVKDKNSFLDTGTELRKQ